MVKAACERSPNIAIATDVRSSERIPAAVRLAGECLWTEELGAAWTGKSPPGTDGVVIYLEGEQLLQGSAADIRRALLFTPGRLSYIAVHLPGIPGADLVSLQPRAFAAGAGREHLNLSWRLAGTTTLSNEARSAFKENGQPWALLYLALLDEQKKPGGSIESLKRIWQSQGLKPALTALVLRNLIVVLLRKGDSAKAQELLKLGVTAYPDYAELYYLTALMWVQRKQPSNAIKHLEQGISIRSVGFVGGGGENSYRAHWLLGNIYDFAGDQARAIGHYVPGLQERPAFRPAVEAILKQRMAPEVAAACRLSLCEVARREPQYFEPVFYFLVVHRLFEMARALLETSALADGTRRVLSERLESAEAPFRPQPRSERARPGVILKGPLFAHSGHARINREIGQALVNSPDLDAGLELSGHNSVQSLLLPRGERLRKALDRQPGRLDLTIRHQWPPDFRRPRAGKLACIIPWEHRAVPLRWVEQIEKNVDELWVPSDFVRSAFVAGGVQAQRLCTIPYGVNVDTFRPEGRRWRPEGTRDFIFLFVGGTIRRKGIDLLLQAYDDAFSSDDDVTLIVKDAGSQNFYQHNNLLSQVLNLAGQPSSPHLVTIGKNMDDEELAALYRGCDVFVLPYRGEGFGMPLIEAMACGKPVITTAEGPSRDFCLSENSYLIPAREVQIPDPPPPLGELSGAFTWFEPDAGELARSLRHVYEHREEAIERGRAAAEVISQRYNWPLVASLYLDRIRGLLSGSEATEVGPAIVSTAS
jgi:glycosyltransferase involved in cell wall biosynthesis/tetratricopeptide (TPR) repeat protein